MSISSAEQVQKGNLINSSFRDLRDALSAVIIGQETLVNRLLIALLADGHLLVEGAPGLAKTTAIKELALRLDGSFHRLQFTPDLLPGDVTGTEIYRPQTGSFEFQPGPIFHNLILADEINRAPAKVQSALLEAMAEHQISVGKKSYPLERPFLVMATQNPIEQEGTYPLPEAQLDRFLMHVVVGYPTPDSEEKILDLALSQAQAGVSHSAPTTQTGMSSEDVRLAQEAVLNLHMAPAVKQYLLQLSLASRTPERYNSQLARWIAYGASPRGTIALARCAKAHAWLEGRDYVSPDDVQAIATDVLRHRILTTFEAEAEGVTSEQVVAELIKHVPVS